MDKSNMFINPSKEMLQKRTSLAPESMKAWLNFSNTVFKEGALSEKNKHLIALAVAHVTQCPYCIRAHTKESTRLGATKEEMMEAIWVASEMRSGAALAHSALAMDEMEKKE